MTNISKMNYGEYIVQALLIVMRIKTGLKSMFQHELWVICLCLRWTQLYLLRVICFTNSNIEFYACLKFVLEMAQGLLLGCFSFILWKMATFGKNVGNLWKIKEGTTWTMEITEPNVDYFFITKVRDFGFSKFFLFIHFVKGTKICTEYSQNELINVSIY